jgi:hypothetical protein
MEHPDNETKNSAFQTLIIRSKRRKNMNSMWMKDWMKAKKHLCDWWEHKGVVLRIDGLKAQIPYEKIDAKEGPGSYEQLYTDSHYVANDNHKRLAQTMFLADTIPIAVADIGTVSLSSYLGSKPEFKEDTIWYSPCITDPDNHPELTFDIENKWWGRTKKSIEEIKRVSEGKYLIGCPALTPGLDCLAMLRDTQKLMMDLIERPEWVKLKLSEINKAYFKAAEIIYQLISLEDGSSAFAYFALWGPGKTSQVQCDVAAMISPAMFSEFVVPILKEQCSWLDNAMFHLDGTQCLCHLDQLLSIKELKAIEWTPQAGIENGGGPRWYNLYRRILDAGKSLQAVCVKPEEVLPLLDAIGNNGVYIMTDISDEKVAYNLINEVDKKWR